MNALLAALFWVYPALYFAETNGFAEIEAGTLEVHSSYYLLALCGTNQEDLIFSAGFTRETNGLIKDVRVFSLMAPIVVETNGGWEITFPPFDQASPGR